MIVVRLQGGLGNQMFQYAYGRELTARGHRVMYDISSYETDSLRGYALNVWRIDAAIAPSSLGERLPQRYGGRGWRGWIAGAPPLRHVRERPMGFRLRFLAPPDNTYLDGYWQSERFFPSIRDELLQAFQPAAPVSGASRTLADRLEHTNAVAIHVRRGDYLSLGFMQVCDTDYYRHAVDDLLARYEGVEAFVFSDDPAWCQANLRFACPTHHVTHTTEQTAHEDLWLISRCRWHVIANSSFSWWGAWLKQDPTGEVYAPPVWSHDPKINSPDIVADRWRTLPNRAATPAVA